LTNWDSIYYPRSIIINIYEKPVSNNQKQYHHYKWYFPESTTKVDRMCDDIDDCL